MLHWRVATKAFVQRNIPLDWLDPRAREIPKKKLI
jgi:hypothetical protein